MTAKEALRWVLDILDTFDNRDAIHPRHTWTEHCEPPRRGWCCYGCGGEFVSTWPQWEEPTLDTFPHAPGCLYLAAMQAFSERPPGGEVMPEPMDQLLAHMQADQTRDRQGQPREGDGVVWVVDHEEPLSPEVAKLLREHPWPFGWSVIRDAPTEGK